MTAPSKRKVPIAQLPAAIEEALKLGPWLVEPLALEFGYSTFTLRRRLEELENEQRVHRVRVKSELGQGVCYRWHHGLAPGAKLIRGPRERAIPSDRAQLANIQWARSARGGVVWPGTPGGGVGIATTWKATS
jgi:hypothetical protein